MHNAKSVLFLFLKFSRVGVSSGFLKSVYLTAAHRRENSVLQTLILALKLR